MRLKLCCAVVLASSVLLSGCMSPKTAPDYKVDPYDPMNRAFFNINQELHTVIRPVTQAYQFVLPSPVRSGVHNFFVNAETVPKIINDASQWNWHYFAHDFARFFLNTTVGILGIFDVASHVGLYNHPQGFGYTLAVWGLRPSPYVVLPFFGPNTMTGAVGMGVDYLFSPITYVNYSPWWWQYPVRAVQLVDLASIALPKEELLTQMALDPYVAVRNAYLQNRAHNVLELRYDGDIPPAVLEAHQDRLLKVPMENLSPAMPQAYPANSPQQK